MATEIPGELRACWMMLANGLHYLGLTPEEAAEILFRIETIVKAKQ